VCSIFRATAPYFIGAAANHRAQADAASHKLLLLLLLLLLLAPKILALHQLHCRSTVSCSEF